MNFLTDQDIKQIERRGLSTQDVNKHLACYRRGPNFITLQRPCDLNDGVLSFSPVQADELVSKFEKESVKYDLIKFVPASGAASRMFAEWYAAMDRGGFGLSERSRSFLQDVKKMPFYSLLKKSDTARSLIRRKNIKALLNFILTPSGLNYGWLPKALVVFHSYEKGKERTALEEHLCEAASYLRNDKNTCKLHFTVSSEHVTAMKRKMKEVRKSYEILCNVKYDVDFSVQSPITDIPAVDENNLPLRDLKGCLVFRPGGHGALLKNLQQQDADFIFAKNIDNIVPTRLLAGILPYKKMLGGLAIQMRELIFTMLKNLEQDLLSSNQLIDLSEFCSRRLNIPPPNGFAGLSRKEKNRQMFSLLNKPLRVCAVVKNVGEPGGAPFWVIDKSGRQTVQIVESGQVDVTNPGQREIWQRAKYFNPVDMVCCIKNYRGEKFNLDNFVDQDAYLISEKIEKGKKLKAKELPGLWNGSMAFWTTVFVELPLAVFNPVKTVYDLLRPEHQDG